MILCSLKNPKLTVVVRSKRSRVSQSQKLPNFHQCLRAATLLVAVRGRARMSVLATTFHTRTIKQLTVCMIPRQ